MEEVLNTLGIDIEKLKSKNIHTRTDTLEILGVSHKTLTKYEKSNYLISNKYKREKYYTTENILDCIKSKTGFDF